MDKLDPRIDLVFKKIFAADENKDLLMSLINSIVEEKDQVSYVVLRNPYNLPTVSTENSILDIKAKSNSKSTKNKRWFNIQIQVGDEIHYKKRALYYWSKLYTDQTQERDSILERDNYSTLNKTIAIHILNGKCIPNEDKYHNVYRITEKSTGLSSFEDFELHTIELSKFNNDPSEKLTDVVEKVKNPLDMWAVFLTRNDLLNKDDLPIQLNNAALIKALTVLDDMTLTPEERGTYEAHLKCIREMDTLEKNIAIGIKEGKVEAALKLLEKNYTFEFIAEVTGLTIEEIQKLKSSN